MSSLEKLKKAVTLSDLAVLLGYKPKAVSYILYKLSLEEKYTVFTIPKKGGGERTIKAPTEQLKRLQKRLADHLGKCYEEIYTKGPHKNPLCHAFRKKFSIVTNAENHVNRRHVFNADIKDFFPTIHFGRVRGFFIKNVHFTLEPKVATVIAQIACCGDELPQGSPCSPVISNLVAGHLDIRMATLAKKAKCTYSRYADDLTFSTNRKEFPDLIAVLKEGSDKEWTAGPGLLKELKRADFTINERKTSLQNSTGRQIATGLVVNDKVNVRREYYKQARSMCYSLFLNGDFYRGSHHVSTIEQPVASSDVQAEASAEKHAKSGTLNYLEGVLSYIYSVKASHDQRKTCAKRSYPSAVMKLYRQFLHYKHFFVLQKPLIICEGKTDVIYLKCALRQLGKSHPSLIKLNGKEFVYEVSFLNMSKNLKEVFAMSEGTPGLASIMENFHKNMAGFEGEGKKHPVILLVDNDSGAKEIKKKIDHKNPAKTFHRYADNLYVILIPNKPGQEETAIEHLFDAKTLSTTIDGKKFNSSAELNPKTEYGKIVFAEKVIKANQQNIDFSGFDSILQQFEAVIVDYNKQQTQSVTS
ncbi:retron Ec67 family RNA-directed DNA polymerase/endonuclease [Geomonas sp. RF6]|uniref:retron Ec67 family RNA-directed DNA polymerase/endonuclease n=1 Tax=Geomonas sp. RF6 TaxID=2897342 RepID=UPI001E4EEBDF|nr:retron Ec67 family RNA-directed DNA polymerase/endonuclease [Geomonas sp. RF6]UFS69474.1 retron Ec67 family RNA-directed DNA polymerase/endonuclease [Geomonas sp. RF6]